MQILLKSFIHIFNCFKAYQLKSGLKDVNKIIAIFLYFIDIDSFTKELYNEWYSTADSRFEKVQF